MIAGLIKWFLTSRMGRAVAGAGALIVFIGGVFLRGVAKGAQKARGKAKEADYDKAQDIRDRVDTAVRNAEGDTRSVDEKLRAGGNLRD